jgi:hypothetical protein
VARDLMAVIAANLVSRRPRIPLVFTQMRSLVQNLAR